MKLFFALCIACAPCAGWAEFALSDLTGNWAGQGSYFEGISSAKMKCRLKGTGDDLSLELRGRCASGLGGARDVVMVLTRTGSGAVILTSDDGATRKGSGISQMSGTPEATQLMMTGAAEGEAAKIQLLKTADGALYFATEYENENGRRWSKITLNKR